MSTATTSDATTARPPRTNSGAARAPTPHARAMLLAVTAWLAAALGIAASGVVTRLPVPVVPLTIVALVAGGVLLYRRSAVVGAWTRAVDVRALVLFHLVRVGFGAAFLVLLGRGALPAEFARLAGPGDIVIGALAPVAALAAARRTPGAARLALAWNALGLADIVLVVLTAQRLLVFAHDPLMFAALSHFPFGALPLFVVPAVVLSHLALFARLRPARS